MPGVIGSLLLLVAFVAGILSGVAYVRAAAERDDAPVWKRIGRWSWGVMAVGVVGAFAILVHLLVTHQFQYAYVYNNTSLDLPTYYLVSSSWAGQEGSFLLWILMNAALGVGLIYWARRKAEGAALLAKQQFEAPVMACVALCQVFMLSMIVGLKLGPLAIGSSPFTTLAAKFPDAPVLQQPGYIPPDGNGLNDLLQNYWMAIHPPTLFAGFTLMIVPFAFAVAGLWKRRFTQWVRPAMPWALAGNMVLLLGIVLGGYWAYETLSFGGYWAWDPVENSSLVPWLFGIAAIHAMIVQKKSGAGHKAALILSIIAFMFVVYSTFLTRSGILGDVSVHSFVDLGLYNQLLLWIFSMGLVGFGLFALRYRELPAPPKPPATLSRESMIFTGALVLCLMGLVIILGTSAPIFGRIFRDSPAGVPIEFYNTWTLPLAILTAFLAGLGQLFWWRKMSVENVNRVLLRPLALTVASTAAVLLFTPFVAGTVNPLPMTSPHQQEVVQLGLMPAGLEQFWSVYGMSLMLLLLLFTAFFAFYGNAQVMWRIGRGNLKLAGGSLTHIGFALMIFGILTSSAFNRPITDGMGASIQGNRNNFVIQRGEQRHIAGYQVTYSERSVNERGRPTYTVDFVDPKGRAFTANTVVYKSTRDQWIQHPDVKNFFERDVYVAVYPSAMMEQGHTPQGGREGEIALERDKPVRLGHDEYEITFQNYDLNVDLAAAGLDREDTDLAVAAMLSLKRLSTGETRTLAPVYAIGQDRQQRFVESRLTDWGIGAAFVGMNVDDGSIRVVMSGVKVEAEDWLVVQAYEKPFINLLWLGTFVMMAGFGLSIFRRASERSARRRKEEEDEA